MFEVDRDKKRLSKLDTKTFGELKIGEVEDLQEWLANCPSALGEELLIIQKEFAGFDDTKERLDLLALDKSGTLVIIENKLDDSGKDVVWQALKYVAYCSTLKKSNIVQIYTDYLKKQGKPDDAEESICNFLEVENIDEAEINVSTNQRFILVAANFRKEVTSTIIWLIANGINAQCMKVTPYSFEGKLLLDVNQIIPTPEARDYMIGMSSKQIEERADKAVLAKKAQLNFQFWEKVLDHFRQSKIGLFSGINPATGHWLTTAAGMTGLAYILIFIEEGVRVEFSISRSTKEDSKRIYDHLLKRKDQIEKKFGGALEWRRLDERKSSKIYTRMSVNIHDEENWESMISWLMENAKKMEGAFKPEIKDMK